MASRSVLKDLIRTLLGSTHDDPAFPDSTLDPIVQQAADALVHDILIANPDYLVRPAIVLAATSPASRTYSLPTDFARVIELRYTDEDGAELREARLEELRDAGADYYAITGVDELAELVVSKGTQAGVALWLRREFWPADMAEDASVPEGIPVKFHDVVALEALFAFGLGGEQRRPPELSQRWLDRRGQLIAWVSHRSTRPRTTRLLQ